MTNEIGIMIELQHYWDNVMRCEAEINRFKKSINTWDIRLKDINEKTFKAESDLKEKKISLKKNELDLEEIDTKSKKTEQRKNQLKSEREIEAQNNELILLGHKKEKIEESLLELMDIVENLENETDELKKKRSEVEIQVKDDMIQLNKKIDDCRAESDEFRNKFNEMINTLSPLLKSKFLKLTGSKDGIAIAKLNGDTCSHCNFKVPSSIAVSASARKSVETCTNCGRFIY